jgi:23S rRNA (cytosine1962-C5)-methyltransferase
MAYLQLLAPPAWADYELIDAGNGQKFERFGAYRLVRPEPQAIWQPALAASEWNQADAVFKRGKADDGPGEWVLRRRLPEQWLLHHDQLSFWARLTPFKHTGLFPEHSAHWAWMRSLLARREQPAEVLSLFGYTGLASLVAVAAGARVVHVDASKPAVRWAQENQLASGLEDRPIRWIIDDALKFVARESRRGRRYDLIVMDPPVFGRGPEGEVWRLNEALPELLAQTAQVLSDQPLGVLVSAYATNLSALTLANTLEVALAERPGSVEAGELVLQPSATPVRALSAAIYASWTAQV